MKKLKTTRKLLLSVLVTTVLVLSVMMVFLHVRSNVAEMYVTDITDSSANIVAVRDEPRLSSFLLLEPKIYVDGKSVSKCDESDAGKLCVSGVDSTERFARYTVSNLYPSTKYEFGWSETFSARITSSRDFKVSASTYDVTQSIPQMERGYGVVKDQHDQPVPNALVLIENEDTSELFPLSAITNDQGAYSVEYIQMGESNFDQEITVTAADGTQTSYSTLSFYSKPYAEISLDLPEEKGTFSLLRSVEAANSCIAGETSNGGIRIQCNDKTPWVESLSTNDCGSNARSFNIGFVKHTDTTKFHNTPGVILKIQKEDGEFVKKSATSQEDATFRNGARVDMRKYGIENGKSYQVVAYDNGKLCKNALGAAFISVGIPTPGAIDFPAAPASPGASTPEPGGSDTPAPTPGASGDTMVIPPMTTQANLCSKMGENYAAGFGSVNREVVDKTVSLRMRWGEGLITNTKQMPEYELAVIEGGSKGVNMILRICFKGSCEITDGAAYGDEIVSLYNKMKANGTLPQNGLFVHAGHNEPNNAEFVEPDVEAAFAANVIKKISDAGILSMDPNGAGVKVLSPNLDLYRVGNGKWPGCNDGCDDPFEHDIWTAASYYDLMMQNPSFAAASEGIYAWAVNHYLVDRDAPTVLNEINQFQQKIGKPIIITEVGRLNTQRSYSELAELISGLESNPNVEAILLFNSFGINDSPSFAYHSELHNDPNLIASLYPNCGVGTYNVPQEGAVPVRVEVPNSGLSGAPRFPVSGSGGVGVSNPPAGSGSPGGGSGGGSGFGGTFNGADPCNGNVCVGLGHTTYTTALGGLVNGDFDSRVPFVTDGAAELKVPKYWHAWYQSSCASNTCGNYSCSSSVGASCRRPEYKQSTGFGNRVSQGDGSAQWFTSFGTHHAGLYQQIDLKQGGTNTIQFKAKGSSWSDGPVESHPIINTFIGRIGIDAKGGTNPLSGDVQWSEWNTLPNVGVGDGSQFTSFQIGPISSSSDLVTVFIAANNEYPYRNSDAYWDDAELYVNGKLSTGQDKDDSLALGGGGEQSVLGQSTIRLPENGEYELKSSVYQFDNKYISNFEDKPIDVALFDDKNSNGQRDVGEEALMSRDVQVEKVGDVMALELKPGLNIVSMPLYTEDFNSAVKIVDEIITQGGYATSVATYRNLGASPGWNVYNKRGNLEFSDDFNLRPGDALYVIAREEMDLKMRGVKYVDPVQNYIKQGWNLITIKGVDGNYDASELLADLNQVDGVTVETISHWSGPKARFESYSESDGERFGTNFNVAAGDALFVKVKSGVGYWTPR